MNCNLCGDAISGLFIGAASLISFLTASIMQILMIAAKSVSDKIVSWKKT